MIKPGSDSQININSRNCKSSDLLAKQSRFHNKVSQDINEYSEKNKAVTEYSEKEPALKKSIDTNKQTFKNMNRALRSSPNTGVIILKNKSQEQKNEIEKPENTSKAEFIQEKAPNKEFNSVIIKKIDKPYIEEKKNEILFKSNKSKPNHIKEPLDLTKYKMIKNNIDKRFENFQSRSKISEFPQIKPKQSPKFKSKQKIPTPPVSNPISNSMSYEELLKLDEDLYNEGNGLSTEKLSQLVPFKCNQLNTCPICQEEITPAQSCCALQCLEKFHYDCLCNWLSRRKRCPVCMIEVMI